ncbi:MAG: dipeptide epimerase [Alphaproteobacteria bacterium]
MLSLTIRVETFPLRGTFTISRGSRTEITVVSVALTDEQGATGQGECCPYARYGQTVDSVVAELEAAKPLLADGLTRDGLQTALSANAARNALDCAFWDLAAKQSGEPVWRLAGLAPPQPVASAYTLSLDAPEAMAAAAREKAGWPLLKLKLAGPDDLARVRAVRQAAPQARLIVDANEGWSVDDYFALEPELADLGVEMVEQPLHADKDGPLAGRPHRIAVCADEACHDRTSLDHLGGRYEMVNIKLDKTGGLTEALALREEARRRGFRVMVGCMMATSLAMAPAHLVAQGADIADLDAPLWLRRDRTPPLAFHGATAAPPDPGLWG